MSEKYKVERSIQIPGRCSGKMMPYPYQEMKAGDSFFIPVSQEYEKVRERDKARAAARTRGIKITTRVVDGGVRIWRTA